MKSFNIENFEQRTLAIKLKFLTTFSFMSIGVFLFYSVLFFQRAFLSIAIVEWVSIVILSINYYYLQKSRDTRRASYVILMLVSIITILGYIIGGMNGTGNLWIFIVPLLGFYLLGVKEASLFIMLYTIVITLISLLIILEYIHNPFNALQIRNTLIVYSIVVIISYFNESLKVLATNETGNAYRNLRKVFENMQDTYYRIDVRGRVEVISDSGYELLGYYQDEILGEHFSKYYFNKDDCSGFLKKIRESNAKVTAYEIRLRHKTGRGIWVLMNAQYIYAEDGSMLGVEGTITNVSEYKQMQENMIELNSVLENRVQEGIKELRERDKIMVQQAKFAQMGELLAMIAHQWRQPLSSVAAITSNLKISMALEEEISQEVLLNDLDNIDEHVALLSGTIDDFRNFFRTDKKHKKVDLRACINRALFVLKPSITKHSIILHVESAFSQEIISLDNEIMQVLINIINNAIDVLSEQKGIKEISIKGYAQENFQVIEIEDNGGGINMELKDKIFEPYFSTKEAKNGTGLGLYMSKTIIQEHCQGRLEVINTNHGAKFRIVLPNKI